MGLYDTYGNEQLKVGDVQCNHYRIGDVVDIPDGIYIGYSSAIVIQYKVFVAEVPLTQFYDKWGERMNIDVSERNPVKIAMDEVHRQFKEGKT